MLAQGMSAKGLHTYTHTGFGCVIRHFQEQEISCVSSEMLNTFLLEQRKLFEQGKIPNWGLREPVDPFKALLRDFRIEAELNMAATSLNTARSAIRRFLFEIENHGFRSLADFTQMNVNGCVTSFVAHYFGGPSSAIFSVRLFLRSCTNSLKSFKKGAKSGNDAYSLSGTSRNFIVFGKTSGIVEPSQRAFYNPAFWEGFPFRLYPLPAGYPTLYHGYWQHEPSPPADFP